MHSYGNMKLQKLMSYLKTYKGLFIILRLKVQDLGPLARPSWISRGLYHLLKTTKTHNK